MFLNSDILPEFPHLVPSFFKCVENPLFVNQVDFRTECLIPNNGIVHPTTLPVRPTPLIGKTDDELSSFLIQVQKWYDFLNLGKWGRTTQLPTFPIPPESGYFDARIRSVILPHLLMSAEYGHKHDYPCLVCVFAQALLK